MAFRAIVALSVETTQLFYKTTSALTTQFLILPIACIPASGLDFKESRVRKFS
jgi:hypothetical protein